MKADHPKIRDTVFGRVGMVVWVSPGEGASVMWRKGYVEWMGREKLNSGRYELVVVG